MSLEEFALSGVLPQMISPTGNPLENLTEAIICDSISGGRQYVSDMPKELSLIRRTKDGKEFRAKYVQVDE